MTGDERSCRDTPGPITCPACQCYLRRLADLKATCTCGAHDWPARQTS